MEGTLALADRQAWAESQFAAAELGDVRRTKRLVRLAATIAGNSSGSIPQQTGCSAAMKAAYRLFDTDGVTHAAVCQPHFELTHQQASKLPLVFLVQDTMVLNFTTHPSCQGLGPIGEGDGLRGLHQQNVLAVDPATRRPLGLMYQKHHRRAERPKGSHANRAGRRALPLEERESYWWIEAIRAVGPPPPGVRWVHVGDRGEDLFGVYDEARRQGTDWLIRLCQDRRILTPDGNDRLLSYALRWIIEEFHKCEKTGCQVEMRRLEHADRLEPLIGLLSVLAVCLLQLKFVARDNPETPACQVFEESMVQVMAHYLDRPARGLTIGEFWGGIGRLGGHPGRKGDGPIGWLRAWRGWQSFQLILLGAHLVLQRSPRCG